MRMLVVGTGDAFSAERFGCSCVVEGPGGHILVDCPDMIHAALRRASDASGWKVDARSMQDIIVTHLHGDHCNGLESLGFHRWLLKRDHGVALPRLHCSQAVADRLWQRLAPAMDQGGAAALHDYFEMRVMQPSAATTIAGIEVRCHPTRHSVPTIALRFSVGDRTIAWSSDTPFDATLVAWLERDAQLVVHETSPSSVHTPIESLNTLPDGVRRRMRLMHMPDGFDTACTDIPCLRAGEVISV